MGISTNGAEMTLGHVALFIIVSLFLLGASSITASLLFNEYDRRVEYKPKPKKKAEEAPRSVIADHEFFEDDDLLLADDILE